MADDMISTLAAQAARIAEMEAQLARLRKPFERCDEKDWRRLDKMLGYSAFGSFWRETLLTVRAALIEGDDR